MNRRSFLTRMVTGIVGVSLVDTEWVPIGRPDALGILRPDVPLTDIDKVAAAALRHMVKAWRGERLEFIPGTWKIGDEGMIHQWHVGIDGRGADPLDERSDIVPAATTLVWAMAGRHPTRTSALPLLEGWDYEAAVATDQRTGLTVRAIRGYDTSGDPGWPPGWRYRLDTLCG